MHALEKWRTTKNLSQMAFADMINDELKKRGDNLISPSSISQWENGTEPRASLVALIEKVTQGAVTAKAWL